MRISSRNPITWTSGSRSSGSKLIDPADRDQFLRKAITDFCDGRTVSWIFRQQLAEAEVEMSPEIDRWIRIHEGDNSVGYTAFAQAILHSGRGNTGVEGQDPSILRGAQGNPNFPSRGPDTQRYPEQKEGVETNIPFLEDIMYSRI